MNLFRTVIRPYLNVQYHIHKILGIGAFGRNQAVYVDPSSENKETGSLKNALFKHHIKQYHEASCSVASVVNVINALHDYTQRMNGTPISQMDILEKVRTANWKERMSKGGDNGKRGLPLFMLGDVVKSSLDAYQIPYQSIETVQTLKDPGKAGALKKQLFDRLCEFDPNEKALIIAHFNQGIFVKALHIPHISPVGGFNMTTGTVTMLDVDFLQEKPYQIPFDTFYAGLSCDYNPMFRSFGYGSGGYVYIRL